MKRIISILLLLCLFCFAPHYVYASGYNKFSSARVGDILTFGSYEQDENYRNGPETIEWIVVEIYSDCLKLVSKYGIECREFDSDTWPTNWKTSEVRKWLNETFITKAFTPEE